MFNSSVQKIAVEIFVQLVTDPNFKKQAVEWSVNISDFWQVQSGNINLHSQQEAVEIACNNCIRKDLENQTRVAAFVTALYMQHDIERAAQVGGSLLKRFGKSFFPRIKDRELRFALKVDSELENYLYNQILNGTLEKQD